MFLERYVWFKPHARSRRVCYHAAMTNLGIIGPGLIWENTHRAVIAALSDLFRVTAVAARSAANQERGRAAYPDATIYSDAQQLIADDSVQAVVILTPIALNAPLAAAALAAGKHAIVEKPLARSLAEAREVVEVAQTAPGALYILEQHVHKSLIATVRELIGAGRIGQVVAFDRAVHVRIAAEGDQTGGYGGTDWRKAPDFPLGNFFDGGIHEVALHRELLGPAQAVFASGRSLREGFGEVDLLSLVVQHAHNVQGVFAHSAALGNRGGRFLIHGTAGTLEIADRQIVVVDDASGARDTIAVRWHDESTAMWQEAAAVVEAGREPTYNASAALADLAFMEALQTSLRSGKQEPVEG